MERLRKKTQNQARRKDRVRAKVIGTTKRPRLTVFISHSHVTAQIVDDSKQSTLVYATTAGTKKPVGSLTDLAVRVGTDVASKAKAAKIKQVVFDRNGKLYHGRIKALAEAARAGGLEF